MILATLHSSTTAIRGGIRLTLQFVLSLTPENERPSTRLAPFLHIQLVHPLGGSVVREAIRVVRWASRERSESGTQYENDLGAETVENRDPRLVRGGGSGS